MGVPTCAKVTYVALTRCIPTGKTIHASNRTKCIETHFNKLLDAKVGVIFATGTAAKQILHQRTLAKAFGLRYRNIPVILLRDLDADSAAYGPEELDQAIREAERQRSTVATKVAKLYLESDIKWALEHVMNTGPVAFDYETTSLTPWTGTVLSVALSNKAGQAVAFQLSADVRDAWAAWLASPVDKIVHHAAFEVLWSMHKYGTEPRNLIWDTRLGARMLDENESSSLKYQAYTYTNVQPYWTDALPAVAAGNAGVLAPSVLLKYNGGDADATRQLWQVQRLKLSAHDLMAVNLDLHQMLCEIRLRGVLLDTVKLPATTARIAEQTEQLAAQIREEAVVKAYESISGTPLNLSSPPQVSRLLYQYLNLPAPIRSRVTGAPSTSAYALTQLKERHPIIPKLLEYRRLTQITKNFLTPLTDLVSPEGAVHPAWNLGGTVTWRLSCAEPNLQNIPKDVSVRELFIPRPGNVYISADYAQIELRILAALSQEPTLLEAFASGGDPHTATAAKLYGVDQLDVTEDQRANGKRLNFAAIYGITASGLEQKFSIPYDEAAALLKRFWAQLPKVAMWLGQQRSDMHEYGELYSVYGRRRGFPDRDSFGAERQAGNFPIQSAAADITLRAMLDLHLTLPGAAYIVGQVHDSILVEAPEQDAATVSQIVVNVMEATGQAFGDLLGSRYQRVNFPVDVKTGKDWYHVAKELGDTDATEADSQDDGE